jgi:hypothetical protein
MKYKVWVEIEMETDDGEFETDDHDRFLVAEFESHTAAHDLACKLESVAGAL